MAKRRRVIPKGLRIQQKVTARPEQEINLSDGSKGVLVGDIAYRVLPSGQKVKLGTADGEGQIIPDEPKKPTKKGKKKK